MVEFKAVCVFEDLSLSPLVVLSCHLKLFLLLMSLYSNFL